MLQVGQAVYFFYFCGTKFTNMNLHEYQGKEILASFGVGIQRGLVAHTADELLKRKTTHRNHWNRLARDQSTNPCRWTWKRGRRQVG